ncbi:type II toxin-antitoxin system RatA family toxin [Nocardiopsis aegyptia]
MMGLQGRGRYRWSGSWNGYGSPHFREKNSRRSGRRTRQQSNRRGAPKMPTVTTSHTSGASPEEVWEALLDSESYAGYMDEVREIKVISWEGDRRVSRWSVLLKGSELEWEEEESIDTARKRIDFHQTEGDLAYFTGYWQVTAVPEGTNAQLHVEFDIGIPMMSDMLNPVAARALEDNSQAILRRLGTRARDASEVGK